MGHLLAAMSGSEEQRTRYEAILRAALPDFNTLWTKYAGTAGSRDEKINGRHAAVHNFCAALRDKMRADA
eukprot:3262649-Prymnesium_polylepis.1